MSALLQVAELNAAYAATIDADRLEMWPDFFVEDCLYKITSAENQRRGYSAGIIYADSRAMLRDRVTALRTANIYERQSYRHIIGLPVLGGPPQTALQQRRRSSSHGSCAMDVQTCSRPASISTASARRRVACVLPNGSSSATAVISTRCLPFRYKGSTGTMEKRA
jgi:hypothetical protein